MIDKYIKWPSIRHEQLVKHIIKVCASNNLGLLLKGSIANGRSNRYSDIDLTIYGRIERHIIETILNGFEVPLMINSSENPPGLLIVAYPKGLAMDLGFNRKSENEESETIYLNKPKELKSISNNDIESHLIEFCSNEKYSKALKLIHKGLLKYLNYKDIEAREFICELKRVIGFENNGMKELDEEFKIIINQIEMTNDKLRNEFCWLLGEAEKQKIIKRSNKEDAQERKSGGGTYA